MVIYNSIFAEKQTQMKTKVHIYLNHSNLVVYCDYIDNLNNNLNSQLRHYIIDKSNLKTFIFYYQLRLHKNTLLNIMY